MMHAVALAGVIQRQLGVMTTVQRLQKTNLENFSFLGFGSNFDWPRGSMCVSLHFAASLGQAEQS